MAETIPLISIIEHAVDLASTQGKDFQVEGVSGKMRQYKSENIKILYTTPFSGVEFLPGQKSYCIDIWFNNKKVISQLYSDIDSIPSSKKHKKEWMDAFFKLGA